MERALKFFSQHPSLHRISSTASLADGHMEKVKVLGS